MNRLQSKTADAFFSTGTCAGGACGATSVSFTYTGTGRRHTMVDATGTTTYTYDNRDRLQSKATPFRTVTYTYDAAGNDLTLGSSNAGGASMTYTYDALNRLTSKTYPDATAVDYVYDLAGKIKQVSDPTGTYGFAYDNMGRLIGTTTQYSFLPGVTYSNAYGYDAASNRTSFTAPDGSTVNYAYDTLNRLNSLTDSATGQFTFGYDALSRRTSLTRPNGVNTSYTYDSLSRLLSVLHQAGTVTLDGASYTYDNAGNRVSKTNSLNNTTENYTYDPLYQLTQVAQGLTTTESYTYDTVGNRLSSLGMSPYAYNSSNELTSTPSATFTYDADGNTLTKVDSSGTTTYGWDFENRLTSVALPGTAGTVTFKYDPFGRRIQKSSASGTTDYVYDGSNSVEEADQTGAELAHYSQGAGIDEPLAAARSGAVGFYEQDGLGSVTTLTSSTGAVLNSYTYDAFGNVANSTGTFVNPFLYTGRDFDPETGLRYYRARYYDPQTGRFLSEDPIRSGFNFYTYVTNDPAKFIDPFGLRNCTKTLMGLICYPDGHPGTTNFDPKLPQFPQPVGLPMPPKPLKPIPVPMPSTLCKPDTDCHDTIQQGLPKPTYGDIMFDPCRGWDFDSGKPLPYNGPSFTCSGNRDNCLDAEGKFIRACEKAGCTGRVYNGQFTGVVAAACCHKQ